MALDLGRSQDWASGGTATKTIPDGSTWPQASNIPYEQSGDYKDFWGNPSHSTLTKPFKPYQRCRQIVFWAVDWQSYVDVETAPSASVDAGYYPTLSSLHGLKYVDRCGKLPSEGEASFGADATLKFHLVF